MNDTRINEAVCIPKDATVCDLGEGNLLFFGGTLNECLVNTFILLRSFNEDNCATVVLLKELTEITPKNHVSLCKGGKIYLHGGMNQLGSVTDQLFEINLELHFNFPDLNPASVEIAATEVIADRQIPRSGHFTVVYHEQLYLIGGEHHSGLSLDVLNLHTLIWREIRLKSVLLKFPCLFDSCRAMTHVMQFGSFLMFSIDKSKYMKDSEQKTLASVYPKTSLFQKGVANRMPAMFTIDLNCDTASILWEINDSGHPSQLNNNINKVYGKYLLTQSCVFKIIPGLFYNCRLPSSPSDSLYKVLDIAFESEFLADTTVKCSGGTFAISLFFLKARKDQFTGILSKLRGNCIELSAYSYRTVKTGLRFLFSNIFEIAENIIETLQELVTFSQDLYITELSDISTFMLIQEKLLPYNKRSIYIDYSFLKATTVKNSQRSTQKHHELLTDSPLPTNLTIHTSDGSLTCHRELLLLRSGYIRSLLSTIDSPEITLPDLDTYTLDMILNYIYFESTEIPVECLFQVLCSSMILDIPPLFQVAQRLLALNMTPSLLPEAYRTAKMTNAASLYLFCEDFMRQFHKRIIKSPNFSSLKQEDLETYQELLTLRMEVNTRQKFPRLISEEIPAEEYDQTLSSYLENHPVPEFCLSVPPGFTDPQLPPLQLALPTMTLPVPPDSPGSSSSSEDIPSSSNPYVL